MADILMRRTFKPWIHPDWLFRLSPVAKEQAKSLTVLHGMTDSVIKIRKVGYLQNMLNTPTEAERNDIGKTRRC